MSTAAALLPVLRTMGVEVTINGDRIRLRPASSVPPGLVESIRAHKPELLALLRSQAETAALVERVLQVFHGQLVAKVEAGRRPVEVELDVSAWPFVAGSSRGRIR